MTEEDLARVSGGGNIRRIEISRDLRAPIERVWKALTESDQISQWWHPGVIEPREGGRFALDMGADCEPGAPSLDGIIKVFRPPHIFEYTWNESDKETVIVRFELLALASETTRVTIISHADKKDLLVVSVGWHEIIDRLRTFIATDAFAPAANDQQLASLAERYQSLFTERR